MTTSMNAVNKSFLTSAGETLRSVGSSLAAAGARVANFVRPYFNAAYNFITTNFNKIPREVKWAGGGVTVAAAITFALYKIFANKPAAVTPATVTPAAVKP